MAKAKNTEIEKKSPFPPLVQGLAEANGVDPQDYYNTVTKTVLKKKDKDKNPIVATREETLSFLMICDRYKLDPFLKQIHGFVGKDGQIQPIVGIDGWVTVVNNNPHYGGHATTMVLQDPETKATAKIFENQETGETIITYDPADKPFDLNKAKELYSVTAFYRKDLGRWIVGEPQWMSECSRRTDPWEAMPRRMLGHKGYMQGARKAFGISGIMDEDEATDTQNTQDGTNRPRARATVDTKATSPEDNAGALPSPSGVKAGNVDEHVGHEGEEGAAKEQSENLSKAQDRVNTETGEVTEPGDDFPDADPTPPPPDTDEKPEDDPGEKSMGDMGPTYKNKRMRAMHAKRKELGLGEDEWNDYWKPNYGIKSFTKLKVNQFKGLMDLMEEYAASKGEETPEQPEEPEKPAKTPAKPDDKETANYGGRTFDRVNLLTFAMEGVELGADKWREALKKMFPDIDPSSPDWDSITTQQLADFCEEIDKIFG